jgi:hypothetical protein
MGKKFCVKLHYEQTSSSVVVDIPRSVMCGRVEFT